MFIDQRGNKWMSLEQGDLILFYLEGGYGCYITFERNDEVLALVDCDGKPMDKQYLSGLTPTPDQFRLLVDIFARMFGFEYELGPSHDKVCTYVIT